MPDIQWDFPLANSVEGRILEAVKARLGTTDLPGIPAAKIVVQAFGWVPDEAVLPPPYIVVSPVPETTPWNDGTNERDDTLFGALISVVLANAREMTRGLGLQLYWRERIRLKFQNKSPNTFTELTMPTGWFLLHVWIESGDKFIEAAKRDQRDAQYFIVRFRVREPRE